MELISQRGKHDCAICAIAMATGLPYERVLEEGLATGGYRPDVGTQREWEILERLGYDQAAHSDGPGGAFVHVDRGILSPDYFRLLAWGRRALVAVPSLNTAGSHHLVFFDGGQVWDPHPGVTYQRFEQLLPDEMILFRASWS